jgi:hypothetical protein
MTIDGKTEEISLPNTVKSEYTDRFDIEAYFEKGTHTITFSHKKGTFVVDSMLVRPVDTGEKITLLPDADRSVNGVSSYLAVAPYDGFYLLETEANTDISVDGAKCKTESGNATVYLRRGLNYIDISKEKAPLSVTETDKTAFTETFNASDFTIANGAAVNGNGYLESIAANSGSASFSINAPESGSYKVTLTYSNNLEGGFHAYNVDLIESFVTVTTENSEENVWCRSTYSWDTYKTVTFNLELEEGENVITLSNNGGYDFNGNVPVTPRIRTVSVNAALEDN